VKRSARLRSEGSPAFAGYLPHRLDAGCDQTTICPADHASLSRPNSVPINKFSPQSHRARRDNKPGAAAGFFAILCALCGYHENRIGGDRG
jgi:hypothetical protein